MALGCMAWCHLSLAVLVQVSALLCLLVWLWHIWSQFAFLTPFPSWSGPSILPLNDELHITSPMNFI
jgi:hypothetical protein